MIRVLTQSLRQSLLWRRKLAWIPCGLLAAWIPCGLLAACSSSNQDDIGFFSTGGSGGIDLGQGGGSGSNGNGVSSGGGSAQSCGAGSSEACAAVSFEAEGIPLDIYVMFDQSGSMLNDVGGLTRLAAVQQAVSAFLRDPESAGIGVGIGYFGWQPIGQVSCDANTYAKPDIAVSLDHEAVIASLAQRTPTGETPTAAALQGACGYAEAYRAQNPSHAVVIVLVTDGKPEAPVSCSTGGCCPTVEQATQQANACRTGKQQIPTYVLGVGPNLDNLHAIAQAGGTKAAYLVGDQEVSKNVLAALNGIRRNAQVPCQIEIPQPSSGTLDLQQVNVLSAQGDCDFKPIYYVTRVDDCVQEGGWYFDNPSRPSFIKLCPSSCDLVGGASSRLKISVGCERVEPPIR